MRPALSPAVADVLNAAAEEVDRWPSHTAQYNLKTGAGGTIFCLLYETAKQLYGWTAIQHLERYLSRELPHGQIQHWKETDRETVAAALRAAAATPAAEDLDVETLRAKLAELHETLDAAVGRPGIDSIAVLVSETAKRIGALEWQLNRAHQQLDEMRQQQRPQDTAGLSGE